jgi:glutathione S-transferase
MMPLKIYGVLRSRASRNVWLAKELGLPYELIPVIQAHRLADPSSAEGPLNTSSPAFHAINPNGLIPCVEDDGLVLNESLAVNLYLAKKYAGPLAPGNLREDGSMMMWSLWAATECEPHIIQIIYHRVDWPEHERDPAIVDTAIAALKRPFGVLDEALRAGGGYLVASGSLSPTSMSRRCFAMLSLRRRPSPSTRTCKHGLRDVRPVLLSRR